MVREYERLLANRPAQVKPPNWFCSCSEDWSPSFAARRLSVQRSSLPAATNSTSDLAVKSTKLRENAKHYVSDARSFFRASAAAFCTPKTSRLRAFVSAGRAESAAGEPMLPKASAATRRTVGTLPIMSALTIAGTAESAA